MNDFPCVLCRLQKRIVLGAVLLNLKLVWTLNLICLLDDSATIELSFLQFIVLLSLAYFPLLKRAYRSRLTTVIVDRP